MLSLAPSIVEKQLLFDEMLTKLSFSWNLPGLRLVGFAERGGAHVTRATGEVKIEIKTLQIVSALTLEVIAAHEAGHFRSHRRRQAHPVADATPTHRRPRVWTAAWLLGCACLMLGATTCAVGLLLSAGLMMACEMPRRGQSLFALEEEVRADAFACLALGGVARWQRAMREYQATLKPGQRVTAATWREQALLELDRRGLLDAVARFPEAPFPVLQCWDRPLIAPRNS